MSEAVAIAGWHSPSSVWRHQHMVGEPMAVTLTEARETTVTPRTVFDGGQPSPLLWLQAMRHVSSRESGPAH